MMPTHPCGNDLGKHRRVSSRNGTSALGSVYPGTRASGGVSNVVLRVDLEERPSFVIKQCRERLRVAMDWRARLDRIWAERAALDVLGAILPPGTVPRGSLRRSPQLPLRHDLRPDDSETWKTHLMNGQADPQIAGRLGTILGTIHAEAPKHPEMRGTLADTSPVR